MSNNGQVNGAVANGQVLTWPRRVLSANDLRHGLNGHRELVIGPDTVVTPLASDELRTNGIRVRRLSSSIPDVRSAWGYGQDRTHGLVQSAVQALAREGLAVRELPPAEGELPCRWAKAVAECLNKGECAGGVLFCQDPGLVA